MLGFVGEVWWSRLGQPRLHAWTDTKPLRLLQREPDKQDLEPKALTCDGVLRADTQTRLVRVVDGRPLSGATIQCLGGLTAPLVQEQKQALWVVWDHASWHISRDVRTWSKAPNRRVNRDGSCDHVLGSLPTNSPWLNRIEL